MRVIKARGIIQTKTKENYMQDILIEHAVSIVVSVVVALIGIAGSWVLSKLAKKVELSNITDATKNLVTATQETVNYLLVS